VNFAFFHADSSPIPSTFISESMKTASVDCPKATLDSSNIRGRRSFLISLILVANIVILVINNITLD
jgi:ribosome-interacting GTPase 1